MVGRSRDIVNMIAVSDVLTGNGSEASQCNTQDELYDNAKLQCIISCSRTRKASIEQTNTVNRPGLPAVFFTDRSLRLGNVRRTINR